MCYRPSVIFSIEEFVVDAKHAVRSSFYSADFAWTYSNEFFIIAYRMSYDCEFFSSAQFIWVFDIAIRRLDCKTQYAALSKRFDTSYPTSRYGVSDIRREDDSDAHTDASSLRRRDSCNSHQAVRLAGASRKMGGLLMIGQYITLDFL
ncbi:hypothetical protein Tco_1221385 [Tanacetum coccineum]